MLLPGVSVAFATNVMITDRSQEGPEMNGNKKWIRKIYYKKKYINSSSLTLVNLPYVA